MRGMLSGGNGRLLGLARDQHGGDPNNDERRHDQITGSPGRILAEAHPGFKSAHQKQRACVRGEHAQPVSRDVRGHAGGLLAFGQAFDPERVDHDILRSGGGGDEGGGGEHHVPRRQRWIAEGKQYDREDQQQLREEEPGASSPKQRR